MDIIKSSELKEMTKQAILRKSINDQLEYAANRGETNIFIQSRCVLHDLMASDNNIVIDLKDAGYSVDVDNSGFRISWEGYSINDLTATMDAQRKKC